MNLFQNRYTLEFIDIWKLINNPVLKWSNLATLKPSNSMDLQ